MCMYVSFFKYTIYYTYIHTYIHTHIYTLYIQFIVKTFSDLIPSSATLLLPNRFSLCNQSKDVTNPAVRLGFDDRFVLKLELETPDRLLTMSCKAMSMYPTHLYIHTVIDQVENTYIHTYHRYINIRM